MSAPLSARHAPYRADIDGLRAVSVAAVILFHAELQMFAGGFVGVDVFFVISGYLITQWLRARGESAAPGALREFYLRRARRILPALLLLLAVTAVFAYLWFLPADLIRFGKYLLAAVFMTGNFAAWSEGDYFNSAVGFAPLLHLWSIAVEEQFYLLFPLLLLAMRRLPAARQAGTLAVLALASFALCVAGSYLHPVANFYIGITRAWELQLGSLVAYGALDGVARRYASLLATGGLAAIVMAIVFYRRDMHHPGLMTLAPALGTAAYIAAGRVRATRAASLLAWRPCVIVGQASYSLYLWHLPPLIFATYYFIEWPRGWRLVAILLAASGVAFAAWAGFEQPLRRGRWLGKTRHFVAASLVSLALLALLGAWWCCSDGLPQRFPAAERRVIASAVLHRDAARCMRLSLEDVSNGRLCSYGPQDAATPSVLVWGDSHALTLLPAFEALGERRGIRVFFAGRSACLPLPGFHSVGRAPAAQHDCAAFNQAMSQAITRLQPDVVVLGAFWAYPDVAVVADADASRQLPLATGLRASMSTIGGTARKICLVRDVPVLLHSVPHGLVMTHRRGISAQFLTRIDPAWTDRQRQADQALLSVGRDAGLTVVDPKAALCGEESCQIESDGQALFRDSNHLSVAGAVYVSDSVAGCFDGLR